MLHVFAEPAALSGETLTITGPDVNHIRNVLRLRPGDPISARVNGVRQEYLCRIESVLPQEVLCRIEEIREADTELPVQICLFQGLPKGDKMEWIVQKAVELGVTEIIPVRMERSIVRLDKGGPKTDKKIQRWQTIAENAAQQSRRSVVPHVAAPMDWKEALEYSRRLGAAGFMPYELQEDTGDTKQRLQDLREGSTVSVFIGPEGGITPAEAASAAEAGIVPISLGRRILRTETAPLVFLSWLVLRFEIQ